MTTTFKDLGELIPHSWQSDQLIIIDKYGKKAEIKSVSLNTDKDGVTRVVIYTDEPSDDE